MDRLVVDECDEVVGGERDLIVGAIGPQELKSRGGGSGKDLCDDQTDAVILPQADTKPLTQSATDLVHIRSYGNSCESSRVADPIELDDGVERSLQAIGGVKAGDLKASPLFDGAENSEEIILTAYRPPVRVQNQVTGGE
jgi:hypothetical protein